MLQSVTHVSYFSVASAFFAQRRSICFVQIQPELAPLISFRNIVLLYHLFVSFSPHRPRLKPLFSCTEPINNACGCWWSFTFCSERWNHCSLYPPVYTNICHILQPVRDLIVFQFLEVPRTRISALLLRRYTEVNYVCDAGEDRKALSNITEDSFAIVYWLGNMRKDLETLWIGRICF